MALIDLKTNLKDLKFGSPPASDRPDSGNSNQPYIRNEIDRNIPPQSQDAIWRGGLNAPLDAVDDVVRLTKFFFDLKSPNGLLFVIKQNLLSRIAVPTQASGLLDWKKAALNEGTYTPLNTVAQAGVNFLGSHLYKQGVNPFKGVRTYSDVTSGDGVFTNSIIEIKNNRLIGLVDEHIGKFSSPNVLSYDGGPNSDVGIGGTNIKFATTNRGGVLKTLGNEEYSEQYIKNETGIQWSGRAEDETLLQRAPLGLTIKYASLYDGEIIYGVNDDGSTNFGDVDVYDGPQGTLGTNNLSFIVNNGGLKYTPIMWNTVYNPGTLDTADQEFSPAAIYGVGLTKRLTTLNQKTIQEFATLGKGDSPQFTNFQNVILSDVKALPDGDPGKTSTIMSISPSYNQSQNKTIEGNGDSRIHQQNPGQKGNILNYSKGKVLSNDRISVVDQINFQPIYQAKDFFKKEIKKNDLIRFHIGTIKRDGSQLYLNFRAFIDDFSDDYSAKWDSTKYMGRGEELHKYGGFSRKISLSFTVAAQSKPELMAQYKKLNYLVSTLAPDYGGKNGSGYMGGNLSNLTLGGWCFRLPGFFTSISLGVPKESPWEIGIDENGDVDRTVKQMPHICEVKTSFTPIQVFKPEIQEIDFDGNGEVEKYGPQNYLQLMDEVDSNYVPVSLAEAEKGIGGGPDDKQYQQFNPAGAKVLGGYN